MSKRFDSQVHPIAGQQLPVVSNHFLMLKLGITEDAAGSQMMMI